MPRRRAIPLIHLVKTATQSLRLVLIGLSFGLPSMHLAAQVPFSDAVDVTVGYAHVCALSAGGAVRCWGGNDEGQVGDGSTTDRAIADAVSVLEGAMQVDAGRLHTCALTNDGKVWCWGNNELGQLGDGGTAAQLTPTEVRGLAAPVSQIALGLAHACALRNDGVVLCWGRHYYRESGDGSTTSPSQAVAVQGLEPGIVEIAAGDDHTCALNRNGGVYCWGVNSSGQIGDATEINRFQPVPVSALSSGVKHITAGGSHTCALLHSSAMLCWGNNWYGQLGDGTFRDWPSWVQVAHLRPGVIAIDAGDAHTCALTDSGAMQCWGGNDDGQLSLGDTEERRTPADVIGLPEPVSAFSTGVQNTCAVTRSGAVQCWGRRDRGQLGDGVGIRNGEPTIVTGLNTRMSMISAGGLHSCGLSRDGVVSCWGNNEFGQLGDGTTIRHGDPTVVQDMGEGVRHVAAGMLHTCAVSATGSVRCWGQNDSGQLGDGSTAPQLKPTTVSGLDTGVTALAVGERHSCALTAIGEVWCWGDNHLGQLGNGTTSPSAVPSLVDGLSAGVVALAAGSNHSCAIDTAGNAWCWGLNTSGQLGDGTTTRALQPRKVAGIGRSVNAIVAGSRHTCAVTDTGAMLCWGGNGSGQLGTGSASSRQLSPTPVMGMDSGVEAIAAGTFHTCSMARNNEVHCWGYNAGGQLGDGTIQSTRVPVAIDGTNMDVVQLTAGSLHSCAVAASGELRCWGGNAHGQLGIGSTADQWSAVSVNGPSPGIKAVTTRCALSNAGGVSCWGDTYTRVDGDITAAPRLVPAVMPGLESGMVSVKTGDHSCALSAAGAAWCWGQNFSGELGDGSRNDSDVPVAVSGLNSGIASITPGHSHTCALSSAGKVMCWGDNRYGQVGEELSIYRPTPFLVSAAPPDTVALATGFTHTCALTRAGAVKCWGDNTNGQLGDGSTIWSLPPVPVSGLSAGVVSISAGVLFTCALTDAGAVKCWGSNTDGELGDGSTTERRTPTPVAGLESGVSAITSQGNHSCALMNTGSIRCWGQNWYGQLGDGTREPRTTPVTVAGLASPAKAVLTGRSHSCAWFGLDTVKCWGENYAGQLGNGTATYRPFPADARVSNAATIQSSNSPSSVLYLDRPKRARHWERSPK